MRRYLTQPGDAGVFGGGIRIKAAGDGTGDEGGALLGQQLQQPFLLGDQVIYLLGLLIQETGNRLLLGEWGKVNWYCLGFFLIIIPNVVELDKTLIVFC